MPKRLSVFSCVLLAFSLGSFQAVAADNFPSRPITFIVPWGPGGGADGLARLSSKLIEPQLKVSLPVINVPGATGQTGLAKLVTSPADGYTIEVLTGDSAALFADPKSRFKADQLIPVAIMMQQASGFYVNATGPMKTWDDVMQAAKKKELKVAITGYGSPDAMTVNYFKARGIDLQGIPFPEPGLRYSSVVGGQSDVLYEQAGDVRSFIDGKQIRPVLFFSKTPVTAVPAFPNVPYSGKLGYNVFLTQFRAIVVRAGTDPKIVKTLSDAFATFARSKEFVAYLKQQYAAPDSFVPAAESVHYMQDWLKEARALGALGAASTGTAGTKK